MFTKDSCSLCTVGYYAYIGQCIPTSRYLAPSGTFM